MSLILKSCKKTLLFGRHLFFLNEIVGIIFEPQNFSHLKKKRWRMHLRPEHHLSGIFAFVTLCHVTHITRGEEISEKNVNLKIKKKWTFKKKIKEKRLHYNGNIIFIHFFWLLTLRRYKNKEDLILKQNDAHIYIPTHECTSTHTHTYTDLRAHTHIHIRKKSPPYKFSYSCIISKHYTYIYNHAYTSNTHTYSIWCFFLLIIQKI